MRKSIRRKRSKMLVKAQPGWHAFQVGKLYEVADGVKIRIIRIYIDASGSRPDAVVKYAYKLPSGKSGTEEVGMQNFVSNVRGD